MPESLENNSQTPNLGVRTIPMDDRHLSLLEGQAPPSESEKGSALNDSDDGAGTGASEVYDPNHPKPVRVGGAEFSATAEERRAADRDIPRRTGEAAEFWGRAAVAIREPPEYCLFGYDTCDGKYDYTSDVSKEG